MDPFTQATLGSMGAHLKNNKTLGRSAFFGALGGIAPDLDYIIRSGTDPLFTIEYHRQFTHSLIFIPIGSLIVSLFLRIFKVPIKESYLFTLLGFATHALLDSCTNYGTQLLWPFNDLRVAWNIVAVIDPLVTVPLIVLMIIWMKTKKRMFFYCSWIWLFIYLSIGLLNRNSILNYLFEKKIVKSNSRVMVKPTIFNNTLWRVIEDDGEQISVLGVKRSLFGDFTIYPGSSARKVKRVDVLQFFSDSNFFEDDFDRFNYFTDQYLHWGQNGEIIDSRYSLIPNSLDPLCSITFKDNGHGHILYQVTRKPSKEQRALFLEMLRGQ